MKVLATFPGRYGDILWALPSVRALSEMHGEKIDFAVAGEFESLVPLLRARCPYLGAVWAAPQWGLVPPNEWDAPVDMNGYDHVYHLGYRTWPELPLAQFTHLLTTTMAQAKGFTLPALELDRPWIGGAVSTDYPEIAVGFTEAHFELKVGLIHLLTGKFDLCQLPVASGRWETEAGWPGVDWQSAAGIIGCAELFFGDCSALHVLAVAMGKKVILMEPMTARHNSIFYPLGKTGRVHLVTGNDGEPTHDSRHCADVLRAALG